MSIDSSTVTNIRQYSPSSMIAELQSEWESAKNMIFFKIVKDASEYM